LHRYEQLGCRLVEAAEEEVRDAKHPEVVAPAVAWAEAERCLNLLDPPIGVSRPDTENAPQMPRPREARIERERAIDQCYLGSDILAEKGERKRGVREDARVVACGFHGLPRAFAAPAAVRLGIVAPVVEPRVADRGQGERRPVMRIALDGLFERTERFENPLARGEGEEDRQRTQVEIVGREVVRRSPS
jgi:hypothetical protein